MRNLGFTHFLEKNNNKTIYLVANVPFHLTDDALMENKKWHA